MSLTIAIGSDHAGFLYKEILKKRLSDLKCKVLDFGTDSVDARPITRISHIL